MDEAVETGRSVYSGARLVSAVGWTIDERYLGIEVLDVYILSSCISNVTRPSGDAKHFILKHRVDFSPNITIDV